ncbi:nitric oxide synthase oxygenase [Sporichthya sp.]|uniref:nitric oxide synthase oxygenase n=1 Tax=Sporichthya sp. TaxID=65475 RepID=UPI001856509B|nr:nitric oxide synthase oxygenase [Sporichthya sp.]MBA3745514.1 nitric oxide synthase oxygenase [Sporichthya sp.]
MFRGPGIPPQEAPVAARVPSDEFTSVDLNEAIKFLYLFHAENPDAGSLPDRISQVAIEIERTGTYVHTYDELAFGARVAWRNNSRCIGRLYWKSLVVRDARGVTDPFDVFTECVEHLRYATNDGKIRPTITIFAPPAPGRRGVRIRNDQMVRYAGYRAVDGSVIGDPSQVDFTRAVERFGWLGEGSAFDLLPLVIDGPAGPPHVFEIPRDAILEVPIEHPQYPWFAELGLSWHAVPAIANMDLHIGGITYTAAPFNGWYMGTEIGSRNFGDSDRYDLLPGVARRLGLDTSTERTLWKDRALLELNVAVLHSFTMAGVTITDHHTESERFLMHVEREEKAGRTVPGDWSWLAPPMSSSATGVFHRYYDAEEQTPAFTPRGTGCPVATKAAQAAVAVCPVTGRSASDA